MTFAAILAAQECGDLDAIEAAETGGSAWNDYLADYISDYTYEDFTLAPLTTSQRADLRAQVLEQAALLHKPYCGDLGSGGSSMPPGEYDSGAEAKAAGSARNSE